MNHRMHMIMSVTIDHPIGSPEWCDRKAGENSELMNKIEAELEAELEQLETFLGTTVITLQT